ncbi:OsmC family protein [Endozoicomonas atrinae]|uniref:OsmC family protein n=1 Tax=Endozoicomonas atrinae TaxID=1333660 RepID=UPI00082637A6|nr:OsmC family protein [Endozoicomonas atrinae]
MKATIQWLGDKRFVGYSEYVEGEHSLIMDAPTQFGGKNSAPSPMEVVLAAAGTCASMDVTSILTQARQDIHDCKVSLTSERSKNPPTVFTAIHMHFDIYGKNLSEKQVERALSLTFEKYCSVSIMLAESGAKISWDYSINSL